MSYRAPLWLDRAAAAALVVFLTLGLVVDDVASGAFALLALLGIVLLVREPESRLAGERLAAHEKVLIFAFVAFMVVAVLSWLLAIVAWAHQGGVNDDIYLGQRKLGRLLRFIVALPVLALLRASPTAMRLLWPSMAAGAWVAGLYAVGFVALGYEGEWLGRVGGYTNPIYYGTVALILGVGAYGVFLEPTPRGRWLTVLAGSALLPGLVGLLLSGARGPWLALPLLVPAALYTFRGRIAWRWVISGGAVAVVLLAMVTSLGDAVVSARWRDTLATWEGLGRGTVHLRLEMWALALQEFLQHPWLGVGPGGYRTALEAAVAEGLMDVRMIEFRHPHSEYLSVLVSRGLLGLAALLVLLIAPGRLALLRISQGQGLCGAAWLALVTVLVFGVVAFSEAVFDRSVGVTYFAAFLCMAYALLHQREAALREQGAERAASLSVILITKDEADRVEACLASVAGWADQIVVLDSGSSDDTVAICQRYTDEVEVTDWPGFGKQKQRALVRATGDWVLSIDADERVSEALRNEIDRTLARGTDRVGYTVPWEIRVYGRRLDFGRWGRSPLRLFRREGARFTAVEVHERVEIDGEVGELRYPLVHETHRDYGHAIGKFGEYAWLQAGERFRAGRRTSLLGAIVRGALSFLDNYLAKGGFLDGRRGLLMAALYSQYTYNKYAALWTQQLAAAAEQSEDQRP